MFVLQIISSDFGFDQAMDKSSALEYINQMFPTGNLLFQNSHALYGLELFIFWFCNQDA